MRDRDHTVKRMDYDYDYGERLDSFITYKEGERERKHKEGIGTNHRIKRCHQHQHPGFLFLRRSAL